MITYEEKIKLLERALSSGEKGPEVAKAISDLQNLVDRFQEYVLNDYKASGSTEYCLQALRSVGFEDSEIEALELDYLIPGPLMTKAVHVCHHCNRPHYMWVDEEGYGRIVDNHEDPKDVFPELNSVEQEFLRSSTCPACQAKYSEFGPNEEGSDRIQRIH